jgi:uncharacterized protein
VILVDANLLLYAHNTKAAEHPAARRWLEGTLSAPEHVGLCWAVIYAFVRIVTDQRAYVAPKPMAEARSIVDGWLQRPNVELLEPTGRHWSVLQQVLESGRVRGALVSDALLAALAIEHGATLCTTDRDFSRFPGLKWMNPIA